MKMISTLSTTLRLTLSAVILFGAAGQRVSAQESQSNAVVTPALLLSFDGQVDNNEADLTWVMENETNCKWFVVERAGDKGGYDSINVVTGLNNKNQTTYSFCDEHMVNGNNYYRLRQVDRDGITRYSKVVSLYKNAPVTTNSMGVYPNPASSTISYTIASNTSQQVIVQVYGISGVVLLTTQQQLYAGNNQQTVAISSLRNGNYFLRVTNREGSNQYVQSFAKIM